MKAHSEGFAIRCAPITSKVDEVSHVVLHRIQRHVFQCELGGVCVLGCVLWCVCTHLCMYAFMCIVCEGGCLGVGVGEVCESAPLHEVGVGLDLNWPRLVICQVLQTHSNTTQHNTT